MSIGILHALYLACLVLLQFGIVTINYRAIAQARYVAAVTTDAIVCVLGWTLFREIATSTAPLDLVGYVMGGMAGSALGIYLTKHWKASEAEE